MFHVPTLSESLAEQLPYMRRVAYRLTRDMDQVDDITQDAYLMALGAADKFVTGTVQQWAAQNVRLTVRAAWQKRNRENGKFTSARSVLNALLANDDDREKCKAIRAAWAKLSPAYKTTIRKAFAKTLPTDGAARKRLCMARQALQALMVA